VEAVFVEAVGIEAVIPPGVSIEEIPVPPKLAPRSVEIVVGPNPADPGRLAGDAVRSDPCRERGRGAAGPIIEAVVVEAVMIVMPEAVTLAEVLVEEVPVASRKLASAPPVEIVIGPNPADPGRLACDAEGLDLYRGGGRIARHETFFGSSRERDGQHEGHSQAAGHPACQKCVHRHILRGPGPRIARTRAVLPIAATGMRASELAADMASLGHAARKRVRHGTALSVDLGNSVPMHRVQVQPGERMTITPPPAQFDGSFADFFSRFVEPNLPSPDRVLAFDALLRRYLSDDDPVHVVRYVRGQTRGTICRTLDGGRILPTDNAPVWFTHALLHSGGALPEDAAALFGTMPHHFFGVARFQTLNQAGYHAAHIISAKNRSTDWHGWTRDELARRMLVNIHPCNMFLVAKQEWTRNGGRPDIIAWVIEAYLRR